MADRVQSVVFDRIAGSYDESRGGAQRGVDFAALAPRLPDGGRILELGVGTGVIAAALQGRGRDVVGVDLSRPMLEQAKARLGARVAQADVQRLPVRDGALSAVCAVWVLHLVADVSAVLAEVARVLAPGGRLVTIGSARDRPDDEVVAALHDLARALRGGPAQDHPDRLTGLAAEAGLHRVPDTARTLRRPASPAAVVVELVEARSYSFLWEVTGQQWREHVVPALARLRALAEAGTPPGDDVNELVVFERR